ncbi:MAG: DUF5985 family protein [Novosphingobium sp.]|nr:DUF5985 family protein [Novosphingobium sp.]
MSPTLPTAVYVLCFLTSAACAGLLGRGYRRSRARLLLWSALCFALLAINNLLVIVDLVILTERTFRLERLVVMLAAVGVLLFGFIWDLEE